MMRTASHAEPNRQVPANSRKHARMCNAIRPILMLRACRSLPYVSCCSPHSTNTTRSICVFVQHVCALQHQMSVSITIR